ncbi:MAG TPA: type II toxin-antitoxin system RelE/ParE family toxin [Candidatus Manganitrophaceae bacterium]|nr:type II toxin-antitoxin system RelE/ParE family toxin [Candidatus Manganitrophaceae bacterium]
MPYRIEFTRSAKDDLRLLRKTDQVKVLDHIERHLTYEPRRQSQSRIKQLRAKTFPPCRLRVDPFRVYYDVDEPNRLVIVYGIVSKDRSQAWLERSTHGYKEGEES